MADLIITAANVIPAAATKEKPGIAGEALSVGDAVCVNPGDSNHIYRTDADSASSYRQILLGLCLAPAAAAGQPVSYAYRDGDVVAMGSILEPGMIYTMSFHAGKICPITDLAIFTIHTTQVVSNVATLTALIAHPFAAGDVVTLASCGSIYNGARTVSASLSATTFSVALTHADDGPNTVTGTAQIKGMAVSTLLVANDASNASMFVRNTGQQR